MPPVKSVGDQNTLVPSKQYPHGHFKFENFNPVQSRLFEFYDRDCNVVIAAATSAGKAQPLSAPILTPEGFVPMGSIKLGDEVIGSTGRTHRVLGVYPQGRKLVYRVHFSDGATADCCEDHLWAVRTRSDKSKGRPYRVFPLKELFGGLKMCDGQNKWYVPLLDYAGHMGELWKDVPSLDDMPIHPYTLGVLLGDGGIKHGVILSSGDAFIVDQTKLCVPEGVSVEHIGRYDYRITGGISEPGKARGFLKTNLLKKNLVDLGLFGLGSCEKFIPHKYMRGSLGSRLHLLHGLMDTDGTANGHKAAEFSSCSPRLAEGVRDLVRSLGGATKIRKGSASYRDKEGVRVPCEPRYRVTVNLGSINPFALPRKRDVQEVGLERGRNRSIDRIEVVGYDECQCIAIDSPDHLYVTSDYVLTHNTICAEMFMAHEIAKRGGKAMYLAPLRALAQEKIDDWTDPDHHWAGKKIAICTGDYKMTDELRKKLQEADVIIMTSEMLNSRGRNNRSENNSWLQDVGTLVVDESHLLTVPGRGDHLEAGLMKFTEINKKARLVLLSATMPNVNEIADWVSYTLTGKETFLLSSTYRPCPLTVHYEKYWDGERMYEENELQKVHTALQVCEYYSDDKFLIFTHTKRTGEHMKTSLQRAGIECEYHNADLDKEKRNKLEKRFKTDPKLRVVVATSTLAWGLNLPARRVIILGVHRGMEEVATYDIWQMAGRAGRPAFDPMGDVYILVPEGKADIHKDRLKQPQRIQSQMLDDVGGHHKVLAFHLVSEINNGGIKTKDDVHRWYKRSLACFQAQKMDDSIVDKVMELLKKCGAVWEQEDGTYTVTNVGKIASMFYFSPFDVADLRRNFNEVFANGKEEDELYVSMALGNVDTQRCNIVSKAEREEMGRYAGLVRGTMGERPEAAIKAGYVYHTLMQGLNSTVFAGMMRGLQFDFPRLNQVLFALDSMGGKWGKRDWIRKLQLRVAYGVKGDMVFLCQLPQVGKVRATKLWNAGFKTHADIANNPAKVKQLLGMKQEVIDEIVTAARAYSLVQD